MLGRLLHGWLDVANGGWNRSRSHRRHASYHGGRLATDAPESPHLFAPKIKSRVRIAGAIDDQSLPDDMKERLEEALTEAGVDHNIETYQAKHGWVFRDTPVYDAAAAERHWLTMLALFDAKLKH